MKKTRAEKTASLLSLLVLVTGLAAGLVLLRSPQTIEKKAAVDAGCGNLGQKCCKTNNAEKDKVSRYCTGSNLLCYATKGGQGTQCLAYKFTFDANPRKGIVDDPDQFLTKLTVKDANFVKDKVYPFDLNFKNEFKFNCNDSRSRLWLGPYSYDRTIKRECGWSQYGDHLVQVSVRDVSRNYSFISPEIWIHMSRREPESTPTPVPTLRPTPIPTPETKRPNGSNCTSGSQCQSGTCKFCPGQNSKCRPNGYICPI